MRRILLLCMAALTAGCCCDNNYQLFVGTYGSAIHVLEYNSVKGIVGRKYAIQATDPSFLAFDGSGAMYAVSENGDESGVYSFVPDGERYRYASFCNQVGANPCHIFPVPGTGLVVTADYTGGSFSVFDTDNARIQGRCQVFDQGVNVHQVREIPSEICVALGLKGRYLLISDLGADVIYVERLDAGALTEVSRIPCPAGSGPRHMDFNVTNSLLYCLTELSGELLVWRILAGSLTPASAEVPTSPEEQTTASSEGQIPAFAEVQRLPADPNDAHGSADVHLHPNGKWLYTSHRLAGDGIRSWRVGDDGLVTPTGFANTGAHPRNFCFAPDGRALLVACRDSGSIQVYPINPTDGTLGEMTREYFIQGDKPVCLVFSE